MADTAYDFMSNSIMTDQRALPISGSRQEAVPIAEVVIPRLARSTDISEFSDRVYGCYIHTPLGSTIHYATAIVSSLFSLCAI